MIKKVVFALSGFYWSLPYHHAARWENCLLTISQLTLKCLKQSVVKCL